MIMQSFGLKSKNEIETYVVLCTLQTGMTYIPCLWNCPRLLMTYGITWSCRMMGTELSCTWTERHIPWDSSKVR